MGTVPIPQGAEIDPQTPPPSGAVAIPQGATIDPAATQPSLPAQQPATQQAGTQPPSALGQVPGRYEDVITQIAGGGSPTDIGKAIARVPETWAQAGMEAAEQYPAGGDYPFRDLMREAGKLTRIPFLESSDRVNQALESLQLAKRMHEAWQGIKTAGQRAEANVQAWKPVLGGQPTPETQPESGNGKQITQPAATRTPQVRTMMSGPQPEGLIEPGNIDLDKRVAVPNPTPKDPDRVSTVESTSFNIGGQEVLLPSVFDGKLHDPRTEEGKRETIEHYRQTGEFLGKFDTPEHATAYSKALHEEQARQYGPQKQPVLRDAPPEIATAIQQAATKYGLEPKLIRAVVQSESNFNPKAKGQSGEIGLMQLMPETRTALGLSDQDAFDIQKNIDAGAKWLKQKIDAHGGDLRHGLTAYNGSGPKARQYADNVLALYGSQ